MNILTISDLHGRTVWKEAQMDRYDRVIFLGDYTDSRVVDKETIYTNLNQIIRLKQQRPDKYVLLLGNHDAQYMHYPHYRCSGFRARSQPELSRLLAAHDTLFQIAHQQGDYLFTHAGVTNQWLNHLLLETGLPSPVLAPDYDVAGLLNGVHRQPFTLQKLLFEAGPVRGGTDAVSGPVWADRSETQKDHLAGFHQVVGHTPVPDFTTFGDESASITYTDVLQTKTAFYEIIIPD